MSNNRNRNRNNRPQITEVSQVHDNSRRPRNNSQDRVFVYKSKTGCVVRIPDSVDYMPSARQASRVAAFVGEGNELGALGATFDLIVSGFPKDIGDTIDLALDELQDFTQLFQMHRGISIPK